MPISKLVYAVINFTLLVGIIWFFGRRAIARSFRSRRESIGAQLNEADAAVRTVQETEAKIVENAARLEAAEGELEAGAEKQISEHLSELDGIAEEERAAREAALRAEFENYRVSMLLNSEARTLETLAAMAKSIEIPEGFDEACARRIASLVQPGPGDVVYLMAHPQFDLIVSSAVPLGEGVAERLIGSITKSFGPYIDSNKIHTEVKVDPFLIGGVCVQVNTTVYDGTIKELASALISRMHISVPHVDATAEDLVAALSDGLKKVSTDIEIYQIGRVVSVLDGICYITGLTDAMYGELLEFEHSNTRGMVLDLEKDRISCVIFGEFSKIEEGGRVRRTGHVVEVPVGEALLGRVVDALGKPIDGLGVLNASGSRPIESSAPGITDRKSVSVPLFTGIKAIDALVPIGKGQRELIIGDRQTGKTAIVMDTIINQKGKNVVCIYVAIGQKEAAVANVLHTLKKHGAMDYTVIVCADAFHSAPMQYIAPYSGTAMGEYFMYAGRDVLIIYDDLSKHAVAYRELSLLLHRPSGREAYPGDVFYLHSRLLERSARLAPELGGGSMTALPIIETQAGDISAYIPTNAISITDGQIFLETELFNAGQRPAVNVGLSVSRVGGAAQIRAMRQVAGRLRMNLAQYRELATFSQFGSDLDKSTKAALARGERMSAALVQPQYAPLPVAKQVLIIYAISEGFADDIGADKVSGFEEGLFHYFDFNHPDLLGEIASGRKMPEELLKKISDGIRQYKESMA